MKEERVELVAGNQPSIGLEPANCAFDDPSLAVATQWPAILSGRPDAAPAMGTDQSRRCPRLDFCFVLFTTRNGNLDYVVEFFQAATRCGVTMPSSGILFGPSQIQCPQMPCRYSISIVPPPLTADFARLARGFSSRICRSMRRR